MARKYFGTDGVRGRANQPPMTAEMALKLGTAAGNYFRRGEGPHRVVIGKDTRRSGYMIENAITAGLTATGMDVFLLGPIPTPGVGILTRNMRADLGVMISASHNPAHDNGIKFFGPDGYKLSDKAEIEIERLLESPLTLPDATKIGSAKRIDDGVGRYIEFAKSAFPRKQRLEGLKVVVDAANGAAYKAAPQALWELGAEVITLGNNPNGHNINKECGSTAPENCAMTVVASSADVGICLDGDADRILIVDEKGQIINGDQLMGLIASDWARQGKLNGNALVATIMSNLGLERFLNEQNIDLIRTGVGDRYVVQEMRSGGYNVGGEQSGHIVMSDYATTGDGLIAALQFLSTMVSHGKVASELGRSFKPIPQKLVNVRYEKGQTPLETDEVQEAISGAEGKLKDKGRLVIRKSGTEPLIRIMAESDNMDLMNEAIADVQIAVKAVCES